MAVAKVEAVAVAEVEVDATEPAQQRPPRSRRNPPQCVMQVLQMACSANLRTVVEEEVAAVSPLGPVVAEGEAGEEEEAAVAVVAVAVAVVVVVVAAVETAFSRRGHRMRAHAPL